MLSSVFYQKIFEAFFPIYICNDLWTNDYIMYIEWELSLINRRAYMFILTSTEYFLQFFFEILLHMTLNITNHDQINLLICAFILFFSLYVKFNKIYSKSNSFCMFNVNSLYPSVVLFLITKSFLDMPRTWVFVFVNLEFFFCIGHRGSWVVLVAFGLVNEHDENSYKGDSCNSRCNHDTNHHPVDNKNLRLENIKSHKIFHGIQLVIRLVSQRVRLVK